MLCRDTFWLSHCHRFFYKLGTLFDKNVGFGNAYLLVLICIISARGYTDNLNIMGGLKVGAIFGI